MRNYKELYDRLKNEIVSFTDFKRYFSSDDLCLDFIFKARFGSSEQCNECDKPFKYYRVQKRKKYACAWCGHQIAPLAGTIFTGSSTPLIKWFYAAYEMSTAKNGMSALELQRKIDVTYKTAWRMMHKIRQLLDSGGNALMEGNIEADEAFIGGVGNKTAVIGAVNRDTHETRLQHIGSVDARNITEFVNNNIYKNNTTLFTDGNPIYKRMKLKEHQSVIHWKGQYIKGEAHTFNIDKLWGQIKRSIKGTYTSVSEKYLQAYLDEFAFRRSLVGQKVFPALLALLPRGVGSR